MLNTIIANLIEAEEYEKAAETFCKETGTKITICFEDVEKSRTLSGCFNNLYIVRFDRNHKTYRVHFHDSIYNFHHNKRPTKYDVLACLTKWETGDFENFCGEYGYNIWADSPEDATPEGYDKKSHDLYKAVLKEWQNVERVFGDVLESLQEIC